MAREVAVDVASHSPQVEPILDELFEALADIAPLAPQVPYYSATSFDPREEPYCDAGYWVDNLRHTVRFAAAVQAALEDGFRVFTELSPHPLLTHAVDQTARSLDMPVAALAGDAARAAAAARAARTAGRFVQRGRRGGLLGALPRRATAGRDAAGVGSPSPAYRRTRRITWRTATLSRCIRCWARTCGYPRSRSATSGRATSVPTRCRGWPITRSTVRPPCRELPTARWRWPRPAPFSARHPKSAMSVSSSCCSWMRRHRSAPRRRWRRPGSSPFVVETTEDGERSRRASAVLHAVEDDDQPAAHNMADLLAMHPNAAEGDDLRQEFDLRGIQYGPAFTGLASANTAETAGDTVLAEVGVPSQIRAQQGAYGVHPALLDACFQSVAAHPQCPQRR